MLAEVANVVWKKSVLLGELTEADARRIVDAILELPFVRYANSELLTDATRIALTTKRTVYDSLYLALAQVEGCSLMTDDRKLHDALPSTSLSSQVSLIEDY